MSFECGECRKTYTTQSSLARHKQNHAATGHYPCSICNVVFYRTDLRARHMTLHNLPPSAETPGSATSGEASPVNHRKRCHTACSRCRSLRTKCGGERPCISCVAAGSPCESVPNSRRVSRLQNPTIGSPSLTREETLAQFSPPDSNPDIQSTPQGPNTASSGSDIAMASNSVAEMSYHRPTSANDSTFHNTTLVSMPPGGDNYQLSEELPLDSGAFVQNQQFGNIYDASWPWVYESLFLPQLGLSYNSPEQQNVQNNMPPGRDEGMGFQAQGWATTPPNEMPTTGSNAGNNYGSPANRPNLPIIPSISASISSNGASGRNADADPSLGRVGTPGPKESARLAQTQEISAIISYAKKSASPKSGHNIFWQSRSQNVAKAFNLVTTPSSSVLEEFTQLYLTHFLPLWPLLSRQTLNLDALHPLLYLVLTSIGAMYGTPAHSAYGRMMHSAIRKTLMLPLEFENRDDECIWLAQARLLTQVAGLYFGQPQAFSYAQHLGCLLIAQARRLDLFAPVRSSEAINYDKNTHGQQTPRKSLDLWLQREARRRLAFGIFRGDTYTSVLLGIKTLVSPEEIDLELPTCDMVWNGEFPDPETCLLLIERDRSPARNLRFSDIYRIAMDQNEPLPALEAPSFELLLFALQGPLWRFSRDPNMFQRLTGYERHYMTAEGQGLDMSSQIRTSNHASLNAMHATKSSFHPDHLDDAPRQMADLNREADKLILALQKWKHSLAFVKASIQTDRERGSLLSSLLLYHLSYMRLHAPMEDLHHIEYKAVAGRPVGDTLLNRVRQWANTSSAYVAAQHACNIWELVTREKEMPEHMRAKFNLLAFTGLHHAATVIWSYAGAARDADQTVRDHSVMGKEPLELRSPNPSQPSIRICRAETSVLMNSFAKLYGAISPAHWLSFAKAAEKLSEFRFPVPAA